MLLQKMSFLTLCIVTATCTGCGTVSKYLHKPKKEKPSETKEEAPKQDAAIGLIELVNPEQQFVLVRTETRMTLTPGTKLITQPQTGTKATLIVTPESKQNFISADIVEGFPKRGDMVILPVAGQPQPVSAASTAPLPGSGPEAMVPGVPPNNPNIPPPAFTPPPAAPAPVIPQAPARPAQKVPSIKVPPDARGSMNAPVDPLPPPLN